MLNLDKNIDEQGRVHPTLFPKIVKKLMTQADPSRWILLLTMFIMAICFLSDISTLYSSLDPYTEEKLKLFAFISLPLCCFIFLGPFYGWSLYKKKIFHTILKDAFAKKLPIKEKIYFGKGRGAKYAVHRFNFVYEYKNQSIPLSFMLVDTPGTSDKEHWILYNPNYPKTPLLLDNEQCAQGGTQNHIAVLSCLFLVYFISVMLGSMFLTFNVEEYFYPKALYAPQIQSCTLSCRTTEPAKTEKHWHLTCNTTDINHDISELVFRYRLISNKKASSHKMKCSEDTCTTTENLRVCEEGTAAMVTVHARDPKQLLSPSFTLSYP